MTETETIEGHRVIEAENLPAVRTANAVVARDEITVTELVAQADKIREVMSTAMKEDVHYGKIPGVNKPTLLKPGAEMLNVLLRLAPSYDSERTFHDDGHLTVVSKCALTHIPTGLVLGEGEGLCSTRETKYAYRTGGRVCPSCGQAAIIKGKAEYGGGWLCFGRKGGCGEKWGDDTDQAREFANADTGRVDNPDLADSWNTVLKMADKRALIAACLNVTAASDIFTQDVEDVERGAAPAGEDGTSFSQPFDPARQLLPGAVKLDAEFFTRYPAQLKAIEPTVDWALVLDMLGRQDAETTGGDQRARFWARAANAAAKIEEIGSFPPTEDSQIVEAFAWAFEGLALPVPLPRKNDPDAEAPVHDDVEWPTDA